MVYAIYECYVEEMLKSTAWVMVVSLTANMYNTNSQCAEKWWGLQLLCHCCLQRLIHTWQCRLWADGTVHQSLTSASIVPALVHVAAALDRVLLSRSNQADVVAGPVSSATRHWQQWTDDCGLTRVPSACLCRHSEIPSSPVSNDTQLTCSSLTRYVGLRNLILQPDEQAAGRGVQCVPCHVIARLITNIQANLISSSLAT